MPADQLVQPADPSEPTNMESHWFRLGFIGSGTFQIAKMPADQLVQPADPAEPANKESHWFRLGFYWFPNQHGFENAIAEVWV